MKPATRPPMRRDDVRLLVLDGQRGLPASQPISALATLLSSGDLLVVNDAATLPGSMQLLTGGGERVEFRFFGKIEKIARGVLLGSGDWRTNTDHRAPPPSLSSGDELLLGDTPFAKLRSLTGRLAEVELLAHDPFKQIYEHGRPVQYSYLEDELDLWSVQTSYASRPVAAEMPSAGRPLSWAVLLSLRRRGIEIVRLTHAAGLSASGEARLDRLLPLSEWYEIPASTAATIGRARRRGNRVVAVGTSVVRALEAAFVDGHLSAGSGYANNRIDSATKLAVVDSILTGLHDVGTSHFDLLNAFARAEVLADGWRFARDHGYRSHEMGDLALIAPGLQPTQSAGASPSRPSRSSIAHASAIAR